MRVLIMRKHTLRILVILYEIGSASTSAIIRRTHAHPESIVQLLRELESLGIIVRSWHLKGRHSLDAHLTQKGLELIETPVCLWAHLFREWNRTP